MPSATDCEGRLSLMLSNIIFQARPQRLLSQRFLYRDLSVSTSYELTLISPT